MLQMTITDAGLDALVDAQNGVTAPIVITELGITDITFIATPQLLAVPLELKRIATVSGQSVAENVIHLTAQDSGGDTYELRGFGLYLADGTLFAVYGQPDPVVIKVTIAAMLISFDVAFADAVDTAIQFGDATFLFPPATETVQGAIEIATQAEADAGVDSTRAVTPVTLATRLEPVEQAIIDEAAARSAEIAVEAAARIAADGAEAAARSAAITAVEGRTITGGGLATGGGDLTGNRVITVTAASAAEALAGVDATKALTPASLASILALLAGKVGLDSATFGSNSISMRLILNPTTTLLVQGGTGSLPANSSGTITFPIAYSVPPICLVEGGPGDFGEGNVHGTGLATITQKPIVNGANDVGPYTWWAIGKA